MSHNKELILKTVQNYANALNSGKIDEVLSFYSEYGIFMPEGFSTLSKSQIGKNQREFLRKSDFKIQYNSIEVKLDEGFAFVNAMAETTEKDLKSEEIVIKTSRDFFVFKKEEKEWKIFRYLFNNVKFIES